MFLLLKSASPVRDAHYSGIQDNVFYRDNPKGSFRNVLGGGDAKESAKNLSVTLKGTIFFL